MKLLILALKLAFAHHTFKCGWNKTCYTSKEICLKGECVPICVDDVDCPTGDICHRKYKVF